jgi:flagellar motor switch protein FliN/FliY
MAEEGSGSPSAKRRAANRAGEGVEALYEVPVEVTAVLGTSLLEIKQILRLGRGAVVELDQVVDAPVKVLANGNLIGYGEVIVVEDRLAVQLTEVLKTSK